MKNRDYNIRSKELCISSYELKKRYYNKDKQKIDIDKVRRDIDRINIDIESIIKNGLYSYNPTAGKYQRVFEELEDDYIFVLTTRLKALKIFINDVKEDNIVIPERLKKFKSEE